MSWLFASGGQSIGASPSASVSPVNILGWFPLGWIGLICLQSLMSLFQHHSWQVSILQHSAFFMDQLSHPLNDYWEDHSFDYMDICGQNDVFTF